jgi:hypothetical protein
MKYYQIISVYIALLLSLTSSYNGQAQVQGEIITPKEISRRVLIDDISPITRIFGAAVLENQELLIVSDKISLIKNDTLYKTIGNDTGQYNMVFSISIIKDTLMIFDKSLSKILLYSISSGKCLKEVIHKDLALPTHIRIQNNRIYALRANLSAELPNKTPLLFTIKEILNHASADTLLVPLNVHIADMSVEWLLPRIVRVHSFENLKEKNGKLYFFIPLMPKLWCYEVATNTVSSLDLPLNVPFKEIIGADNAKKEKLLLHNPIEMVTEIKTLNNYIAIKTIQKKGENGIFRLRLISYSGKPLGVIESRDNIIDVNETTFLCISLNMEGTNIKNPYSLISYSYKLPSIQEIGK